MVWALMYNMVLVPIAMGVLYPLCGFKLDPMLSGFAMAFSSISVVISSLLIRRYRVYEKRSIKGKK